MTSASRAWLLPCMILTVAIGTVAVGALTPRDLSMGEAAMEVAQTGDLLAFHLSRATTALLLALASGAIAATAISGRLPKGGLALWRSYLIYAGLNFVLPGFTGRVPGFDVRYLYPALVMTAVYVARPISEARFVGLCKLVLGVFIYGGLAAALLAPDHAIARDYLGVIPGLDVRLYGVAGGATTLGALSAAFLAIEAFAPSSSRLRILHSAAALLTLILTQSKTAWAFVIGILLWLLYRKVQTRIVSGAQRRRAKLGKMALRVLAGCVGVLLLFLLSGAMNFHAMQGADNVETLTGRLVIWETTVRLWLDNPVFGYGLSLWADEGFRAQYGHFAHSHNQVLHVLGSAGLAGLVGLVAYLRMAVVIAIKASAKTPIPAVFLALVAVESLTEVPLRNVSLLEPFFLLHLLLFTSLMLYVKIEARDSHQHPALRGAPGSGVIGRFRAAR